MTMAMVTLLVEELGQGRVRRASNAPGLVDVHVGSFVTLGLKTVHAAVEVSENKPMLVEKLDNAGLPPV